MLIFFLSLFLLIFFEVKCVVDRSEKWQRPFTKGKFAPTRAIDGHFRDADNSSCVGKIPLSASAQLSYSFSVVLEDFW